DPGKNNAPSTPPKKDTNKKDEQKTGTSKVYTVKSGDTLSHIARAHNVTVANLKKWNNLTSDLIHIEQKLNIGEAKNDKGGGGKPPATEKPKSDVGYNVDKLIEIARAQIGTPYQWAGSTPSGFDCSGFIHYAYNNAGKSGSRTSTSGYFDRSFYVNTPKVGELVFFFGT